MPPSSHFRFAVRKRRARELSASERRSLAPRPPRGAQIRYLALVARVLTAFREATERRLLPLLPRDPTLLPEPAVYTEPIPYKQVARLDALPCGPLPIWYADLLRPAALRQDAWVPKGEDRYSDAFDALQRDLDEITAGVETEVVAIGRDVVRHNAADSERVLGQSTEYLRPGSTAFDTTVRDFVRRNVGLVKSVGRDQLERLETAIREADKTGLQVAPLRQQIQESFALPRARAELIARDQVLKLNSQITQERQKAAGIDTYIWTTVKDERVRGRPGGLWAASQANHWALDGTRQRWSERPITNPVTGARHHPGEDFQCRCQALPDVERILYGEPASPVAPPVLESAPPPSAGPLFPWLGLPGSRRR